MISPSLSVYLHVYSPLETGTHVCNALLIHPHQTAACFPSKLYTNALHSSSRSRVSSHHPRGWVIASLTPVPRYKSKSDFKALCGCTDCYDSETVSRSSYNETITRPRIKVVVDFRWELGKLSTLFWIIYGGSPRWWIDNPWLSFMWNLNIRGRGLIERGYQIWTWDICLGYECKSYCVKILIEIYLLQIISDWSLWRNKKNEIICIYEYINTMYNCRKMNYD